MPLDNPEKILKHFDVVKANRSTFESIWDEVCDFGLARRSFQGSRNLPQGRGKRTRLLYDNSMMVANELWAAGFHNLLTPTALQWVHLEPEDEHLLDLPEVSDWYERAETILVEQIERHESGFHDQISEVYADIGAFGNGALSVMYDDGLYFQAMPLAEVYLEEDARGRIIRLFRDFEPTAAQAMELFGDDAPRAAREHYDKGNLGERVRVVQALLPNPSYAPLARYGPALHRIESWFLAYQDRRTRGGLIRKEFFRELPIAFGRLAKDSDELYARGPGVQAISDQRMLNKMKFTVLRGAEKAIDPPMLYPDGGFVTQVDLSPGGKTIYRATSPERIRPLYDRASQNVELGVEVMQHTQVNIRAAYHYELLQMIQDPRMSATQVLEISGRLQQILSPEAGRLQSSLLEPTVSRSFRLLLRNRRFPPVPPILAGTRVRFRYVSPVQRAQRVSEARAALEALQATLQFAQFDPRALDPINTEEHIRFFYDAYGVTPYLLRPREEVAALRDARARREAQMDQRDVDSERADQIGKALPAISQALESFRGRTAA